MYTGSDDDLFSDNDVDAQQALVEVEKDTDTNEQRENSNFDPSFLDSIRKVVHNLHHFDTIVFPSMFDSFNDYYQTMIGPISKPWTTAHIARNRCLENLDLPYQDHLKQVEYERSLYCAHFRLAFVNSCLEHLSNSSDTFESNNFSKYFYQRFSNEQKLAQLNLDLCISRYEQIDGSDQHLIETGIFSHLNATDRLIWRSAFALDYQFVGTVPETDQSYNKTINGLAHFCKYVTSEIDRLMKDLPQ